MLIAGGIGITPLMSMIRRLESLGRPWELFYAARTRRAAAFLDDLASYQAERSRNLHVDFDDERVGADVRPRRRSSQSAPAQAHLYCCGPRADAGGVRRPPPAGRPGSRPCRVFPGQGNPGARGWLRGKAGAAATAPIAVEPGKTILDALLDAGISANYACSEGVCGTCETRVIEGIPDHRDLFLSQEEQAANKTIMICCSGSKSGTLVLDL